MLRILLEFEEKKGELDGKPLTAVCFAAKKLPEEIRAAGETEPTQLEKDLAQAAVTIIREVLLKYQAKMNQCGCPSCTKLRESTPAPGEKAPDIRH
jgi:hypothetical protein